MLRDLAILLAERRRRRVAENVDLAKKGCSVYSNVGVLGDHVADVIESVEVRTESFGLVRAVGRGLDDGIAESSDEDLCVEKRVSLE